MSHIQTQRIHRFAGDTNPIQFTISRDGAPLDLTGALLYLTVDPEPAPIDSETNVLQLEGVIADAPGGVVQFTPTEEQAEIEPGKYRYDVLLVEASGAQHIVIRGRFDVDQRISRKPVP
jgi:hypothetical protein